MTPQLWGLSDLHVGYAKNRDALATIRARPHDWLILGGDIGETEEHLRFVLDLLGKKFARLLWVPGNHELWTPPRDADGLRGVARYERLVEICRERDVLTPEDPWAIFPGERPVTLALLFLLYDYTFAPDGMSVEQAIAWAGEQNIKCTDEFYLHPDPYPSRQAWCAARVNEAEARLTAFAADRRLVLVNHFPLRQDVIRLFRIPRFSPWCGTRRTEDWHRRFPVDVVVSGHLHMRATDWRDGVRFEEISLGYPQHWREETGPDGYLRRILPGPPAPQADPPVQWHR